MKFYVKPEADIELLENEDILTTSFDTISNNSSTTDLNEEF